MPIRPITLKWRGGKVTHTNVELEEIAKSVFREDDDGLMHAFEATNVFDGDEEVYLEIDLPPGGATPTK